jgi:MtN3 and saliva related transmembrane protein
MLPSVDPQAGQVSAVVRPGVVEMIGTLAGLCTTAAFLPQVLKTWRSGSARDLSLTMLLTFCVGLVLWLCYGLLIRSAPVVAANTVTLALAAVLVWFKVRRR